MTVYRVTGFTTSEKGYSALVEARTEYDAKRYVAEDINGDYGGSVDPTLLITEKVFQGITYYDSPQALPL